MGNLAINSGDKNKNKVDEINKKYDNPASDNSSAEPQPGNAAPKTVTPTTPAATNSAAPDENLAATRSGTQPVSSTIQKEEEPQTTPGISDTMPAPLSEAQMREKMQKIVTICEGYNQNGITGKFVPAPDVQPWSQYDTTPHQRAYCIFVKPVSTGGGKSDPIIAASAEQYRENLNKFAMDGYVYAPDDARGLRCRNLFESADLGGIPWHGQYLPTGPNGYYTACEFSYKF